MTSLPLLSIPIDGQEFLDLDTLSLALDNWAVKEKFSYRVERRDKTRGSWVCASALSGCLWRCRATYSPSEDIWQIHILETEHSCSGAARQKFSSASKKDWLDRIVAANIAVTQQTPPQQILDLLRIQFAEDIDYKRAQECRLRLLDGDIGKQRHSFQLLPAYKELLETISPAIHIDLLRDRHQRFERIFICPAESRSTYTLCRRLLVIDGTFLKGRFILTLLLAVTIDANGETIILAWAVVESENKSSWTWFLQHLRWAIPEVSTEQSTILSDRGKGLLDSEKVLGPLAIGAWCCHHIKENFTGKCGRGLASLFWTIARAPTLAQYEAALEKLRQQKPEAAAYLEAANPSLWAEALFSGRRYGHDTSNIVESQNGVLSLIGNFELLLSSTQYGTGLWRRGQLGFNLLYG